MKVIVGANHQHFGGESYQPSVTCKSFPVDDMAESFELFSNPCGDTVSSRKQHESISSGD